MHICVFVIFAVVFVSPELLQLPGWKKVMSSKVFCEKLAIVAIDEAHWKSLLGSQINVIL